MSIILLLTQRNLYVRGQPLSQCQIVPHKERYVYFRTTFLCEDQWLGKLNEALPTWCCFRSADPLPPVHCTITLLQQKVVRREKSKTQPFVKILTKMTAPAPNCNSVSLHLQGKETVNLKFRVDCPGLRKHQRRMAGRRNDYTETVWDANNPLKILLGLKVRSGCWGKVKLPKPSNLILSNNIKEQCLNTKEIVHAAAKEFMYLEE